MATPYRKIANRLAKLSLLAVAIFLFPAASLPGFAQTTVSPKRVLVLYWDNKDFPGNLKFDENFKSQLEFVVGDYEYYPEYMETTRFQGADQSFFHEYLKQKYAGRNIDVVVATADIPLTFMIQYHSDLFANAPIVFVANNPPSPQQIAAGPGMTGIIHQSSYVETVKLALKLHPDTNQLFVISGSPNHDKRFESVARTELAPFEKRVNITYLTDFSLQELTAKTASLPPRSLALYIWQQATDERGKLLETYEVIARIAPTASVPIYGMGSGNLGHGIVGGFLQGPDSNGSQAAEITGRILNGKSATDIPVSNAPTIAGFDWRQLRRWGIAESQLPPESVVQFKVLTFWEERKWYIIGSASAILVEAALIAFLLISLRRVTRLTRVAKSTLRRLDETVSNVPGIVWESMIDPVTNRRKTTFISDYVEKLLGYTPTEWLSESSGFGGRIVHDDDRENVLQESENAVANGRDGYAQFRWRRKDGKFVWVENYLSPIFDSDGKVIGLRGVATDINDRKHAEEIALLTEEKDRAILEAVPDLMFLHSPEGDYLDYHCKDERELLLPPDKFLGKNFRDVLPAAVAGKLATGFERVKEGVEPYVFEYELPVNGTHRWYEARMLTSAGNLLTVVRDVTARRNAELSLRQSEEKNRAILEAIPDLMFLQTREGVYLDHHCSNPEDLFVAPEAFIGKNMRDILPSELAGKFQAVFERAVATGETQLIEYDLTLQGAPRWFEARIVSSGENVLSVIRDITGRKLAEAALIESELSYRSIFNAANDAIFVLEQETGAIIDINERMCEMYACTAENAMTFGISHLSSNEAPYTEQETMEFVRKAGAGTPQLFEWHARKASGELFWVEVNLRHMWLRGKECLLAIVRDITERKRAETLLAESHRRVTEIIESIGDAFYSVDNDLRFTYVNRKTEELWALRRQDLIGKNFLEVFPEAIGTHSYRECMRAMKEGRPISFEAVSPILNRWVEVSVYPAPAGLSVYFRDITKRKTALDELRQSEERFGKAFRANPQPMSLTALSSGRYLDVNESFLAMSGYRRDEVIGQTSLELNIWENSGVRQSFVNRLQEHGSIVNHETKFRAKDGSLRILLSSAEQLEIAGETCLLVASSDITERMQAQQALKESEERFRQMADTAPVMIWIADINRQATYFNQQWLEFKGRALEQELGSGWTGGIHPSDADGCLKMFVAAFDSREPFRMEYRVRRHDGVYRWVIDTGTPRFSSAGDFLGYIGSSVDITDRKDSEAALVFAHEALENAYAEVNQLKTQLQEENIYLQEAIKLEQNFGEIVGASDALKYVLFKIEQVAPTDSTVLITGETGTGKELVARAIHTASTRRDRPMVKVNCAALSASLIESELFGHERGAFTGALTRKIGRFELAAGGTIFLDEIGELPLELQVKLLRIIQEGEFERLGSSKTVKIDVRIIAATNRNLKEHVNNGLFREDLWYRLNVFPITVPPLRQRREDIPMLIEHFTQTFARKMGKEITSIAPSTVNALCNYSWPGNVRELANVIERAVINAHGRVLRVQEQLRSDNGHDNNAVSRTLEEVERDHIIHVLDARGWKIEGPNGAAHLLGMNPSTLRTRMAKLRIAKPNQRAAGTSGD